MGAWPGARRLSLALALVTTTCWVAAAAASAATWHVRSGATPGGTGSAAAPFASLAAVEAAAAPGDTIVIDPAPLNIPPLDGGIALKPGQRLEGGGPAVVGSTAPPALPVVTNTTDRVDGDGVRLADNTVVTNLVVRGTRRGGIYGIDSVGVSIDGNDVSKHNTSCTKGFLVQPFNVPTGLPFVGGGVGGMGTLAPQNGWAGIMVDGSAARGSVAITGNVVHDADCGDGIDIRAAGSSDLSARVDRNLVTRLREGEFEGAPIPSVLAIGMQARDSARLRVRQDANTQTFIGSAGADCEGQFANTSEAGVILETVDHNTFAHGIGGSSCNGFEAIVSNGGGTIDLTLRNSTFEDTVGDMFEEGNLGAGSTMRWDMQHVIARTTKQRDQNSPSSSDPGANPIPFNLGDCMVLGHNGAGNSTSFRMRDSVLEGCNNGISALSGQAASNGIGPAEGLTVDIERSRIAGNARYGLQVVNTVPLRLLRVNVANTEITGSGSYGAAIDEGAGGTTGDARLDLGGGSLGSAGGNCLFGNAKADVETTAYEVSATRNWWGRPGGAAAGRVATNRGGQVRTGQALPSRPDCAPRPPAAETRARRGSGGPTGLTVRVRPDGRRRFVTTGSVVPPRGVSRTAVCEGLASVQVQAGRTTISNRRAVVTRKCRFRSAVVFGAARRFGRHRRLRFTVRFEGNAVLARRTAKPVLVRVRPR